MRFINRKISILLILIIFIFLMLWYLKPQKDSNLVPHVSDLPTNEIQNSEVAKENKLDTQALKFHGIMPILAPSLQGTEVNCPLQVDAKGQLILSRGIRDCFDYFLSSVGEKTESNLIADIRQYLTGLLPDTAQPYAFKLLNKYIDRTYAVLFIDSLW